MRNYILFCKSKVHYHNRIILILQAYKYKIYNKYRNFYIGALQY